jgi:hypothetical protein
VSKSEGGPGAEPRQYERPMFPTTKPHAAPRTSDAAAVVAGAER